MARRDAKRTTPPLTVPGSGPRARWVPVLLLLGHLALGLVYLCVTPAFEAPDEPAHYRYVRHLVERRALPPLIVGDTEWDQGQMHQPPLYYTLGALLVGRIEHADAETVFPRNPFVVVGRADTPGNKNVVLHREDAAAAPLLRALRRVRGLSLACSAATVALTYALGQLLAPRRPALAALGAALVAFNPQFLFIGTSVNNDALVTLCATLVLYLAVRAAVGLGGATALPLALGAAVGAAGLTKLSGLATAVPVVAAYSWRFARHREEGLWRGMARPLLLAGVAAVAVCGWWYGRNAWLYQDPLGMRSYARIFAVHEQPLPFGDAVRILGGAVISYWGVFGWMNVATPEAFYTLVRVVGVAALLGNAWYLLQAARRGDRSPLRQPGWCVTGLWLLVVLALLLRWTQTITRTQGRLAFPAAAVIGILLAHGLATWLPRRFEPALAWGLGGGLAAIALAIPFACIRPAYCPPATLTPATLPATAQPVRVDYAGDLRLVAYELPQEEARPGEPLGLRLYWETDGIPAHDYAVGLQLLGRGGERIGGLDTHPAMGLRPTSGWTPGRVVVDDVTLRVAQDAEAPVAAALRVSLYHQDPAAPLEAFTAEGAPLGPAPQIATIRVAAAEGAGLASATPTHGAGALFDERVELVGYDFTPVAAGDGATLELVLHWRCLQPLPAGYTIFVHLVNAQGETIAQADGQPLEGAFPLDYWRAGDVVRDVRRLTLPAGDGHALGINLGFYHTASGERLPVRYGADVSDHVSLHLGILPGGGGE
jgi:hypothetical protein